MLRQSIGTSGMRTTDRRAQSDSPAHSSFDLDTSTWSTLDLTFTDDVTANDFQSQSQGGDGHPSTESATQRHELDEFLMIDGLLAFDETIPTQQSNFKDVAIAPYETLDVHHSPGVGGCAAV